MPHPRGGLAQAEGPSGLAVGQLLEVAEEDDLAIGLVEAVDRLAKPPLQLPAEQRSPRNPRASEPPATPDPIAWKPLIDDDVEPEAEPLLDSLKKTGPIEIDPPEGERGPGRPLN